MIDSADVAAIVSDPKLTPEAVRVILHVAFLGAQGTEHDVKGEALAIILGGGEKPIRKAIDRGVFCGYLSHRHGGRAGHKLTYLGIPENPAQTGGISAPNGNPSPGGDIPADQAPEIPPLGETFPRNPAQTGGISGAVGGVNGGATPPPPPPSSPPGRARAGGRLVDPYLERLREYLGPYGDVVDRFDASANHPHNWATNVFTKYRLPGGSQDWVWSGVPAERAPAIIATALENLMTDKAGEPYAVRLFETFLTSAKAGPKVAAASTRSQAVNETPGSQRIHRGAGSSNGLKHVGRPEEVLPDKVLANIRKAAAARAGPAASEEAIDEAFDELLGEYQKRHMT